MLQRPRHRHGVQTDAHYEARQRAIIADNRARIGARKVGPWAGDFRDPWDVPEANNPPLYVGAGCIFVRCIGGSNGQCGDAVSVDPDWRIGRCCWCGAVYRNLVIPDNFADIEDTLLRRPLAARQNWLMTESVDDLRAENVAYGIDADPAAVADAEARAQRAASVESEQMAERSAGTQV